MTAPRLALCALLTVAGLAVGGRVALADCVGPTVGHTGGDLTHGEIVTVSGYGFGDNCYDTGPPPPGEGSLGRPLTGIEVYAEQNGLRHLVAVGDADMAYEWEVEFAVPAILDVGDVDIVVVSNGFEAFEDAESPIWVLSDRDESAEIEVVTFGLGHPPKPHAAPSFPGTDWAPVLALSGSLIAIAAILAGLQRRSTS